MKPKLGPKLFAISLPILFATGFISAIFVLLVHQTPAWKFALNEYVMMSESRIQKDVSILEVVKAKNPWRFLPEMSYIAFGDSVYYQTTRFQSESGSPFLAELNVYNSDFLSDGRRPIPYPPDDAWCAHLRAQGSADQDLIDWQVVIARHSDLYNADFIIHEIPRNEDSVETQKILIRIGCDFKE